VGFSAPSGRNEITTKCVRGEKRTVSYTGQLDEKGKGVGGRGKGVLTDSRIRVEFGAGLGDFVL